MRRWLLVSVLAAACGDDGVAIAPDADPGEPTPESIEFEALDDLPSGAWLLANDWAPTPNVAFVLPIDDLGAAPRALFAVNRVWSMGAAPDGSAIYFSAWDAQQEAHFGVTIGDAIQNSFVYDPATRTVDALAWGNINDECQEPTADGRFLYLCRRYDFDDTGAFSGWRAGRIDLETHAFEFVLPDDPTGPFELAPQQMPDGALLYEARDRPPASGDVIRIDDEIVTTQAGRPELAPDGRRILYQSRSNQSRLFVVDLDQPLPVTMVSPTLGAGAAAWSPDGDTIVYTVFDGDLSCDHLERVTLNGGAWSAPERVRDCATTGEFITDIAWIVVP